MILTFLSIPTGGKYGVNSSQHPKKERKIKLLYSTTLFGGKRKVSFFPTRLVPFSSPLSFLSKQSFIQGYYYCNLKIYEDIVSEFRQRRCA